MSAVRVTKAAERDHAAPVPGTHLGNLEALIKNLERLLHDTREQKREFLAGRGLRVTKTRECVPSIVNLVYVNFPADYAE